MKGQKDYVVELVKHYIPTFVPHKDVALVMLTNDQLESIKNLMMIGISGGVVKYSKDPLNLAEVTTYSRSCVMNYLKKCAELNGGVVYTTDPVAAQAKKEAKALKGIDLDSLPADLKAFVQSLI